MKNFVGILDKGFELTFTKNKAVFEKNDYEKKNFTFIFVYLYCVCKLHMTLPPYDVADLLHVISVLLSLQQCNLCSYFFWLGLRQFDIFTD